MNINLSKLIIAAVTAFIFGFLTSLSTSFLFLTLIILPGFFISDLLLNRDFYFFDKLIVSIATGFTFIAFTVYLFSFFPIGVSQTEISLIVILLSGIFLIFRREKLKKIRNLDIHYFSGDPSLLLLVTLAAYLIVFFLPTKGMNSPLFTDAVLHGTIARLFIENGGIPETWTPFAEIGFNHQPGFASIIFWIKNFSTTTIPELIIHITGFIHVLFPFGLYFFSRSLFKNKRYNYLVLLFGAAALFPMALFRSGSNATVLTYFLVPVLLGVVVRIFKEGGYKSISTLLFLSLSFTGALLIHPQFGFFMFFLFIPLLIFKKEWPGFNNIESWKILFLATCFSVLFSSIFFFNSVPNSNLIEDQWDKQAEYINPQMKISPYFIVEPLFFLYDNPSGDRAMERWVFYLEDFSGRDLVDHPTGIFFSFLFILSLIVTIKKKFKPGMYGLSVYLIFLVMSWVQSVIKVSFFGWQTAYPSRFKFFIALPVALIVSSLFLIKKENISFLKILNFVILTALFLSTVMNIVFLSYISEMDLLDESNREAMEWIKNNTSREELFLNRITEVDSGVFIGGAAQWIPAVTGNPIFFPALSLTEEVDLLSDRIKVAIMMQEEIESPYFLEILRYYDIDYIYISEGMMHSPIREFQPIMAEQFENDYYQLEFKNKRVYIFSINYPDEIR